MSKEIHRSSAKERGKRLRLVRKMSCLTLNDLSTKYDFGASTIKYWECAKCNGLSAKGAKKIIGAIQNEGVQCSFMWLMYGIGSPPQFIDIRYNTSSNADSSDKDIGFIDQATYDEELAIECEMNLFCEKIAQAITLTVLDDGMAPFYSMGDSVGGKRLYGDNLVKAIGKDCIVETVDNQVLCRRIAKGSGPDTFNLCCTNPNTLANPPHLYDVNLLSVAPISRIWRRMVF